MSQPHLFLSLKRDLALAIQEVFVAEKFIEDTRKKARTELEIRLETENSLIAATVTESGTFNDNFSTAITVTEMLDSKLAIIPGLDGYDS
ncbi:hypothetical protein CMV_016390 [Castanea mollissima]|uniref:Uncharacterized protein n=1 Tax=Castanea mollissima TaxID=60419 RepID=A0A8J4R834_9ROSI|nr:hypothetical protein CMV_016390 [Castanea mollissima]